MRPENQNRLARIKKTSRILQIACKTIMVLVTLIFLASTVALLINRGGTISYASGGLAIGQLTRASRFILLGVNALTLGIIFKCFFHLNELLGNYSEGQIFTAQSTVQIRKLGVTCVLWGAMNVVWCFLPLALLSNRPKSFAFNPDLVLVGLMIVIISWFMEMAVEIQEENELTV